MQRLPITGYQGEPVPHKFFCQDHTTEHLAFIFPGQGYTTDHPLLYFSTMLLQHAGADVLCVDYNKRANFETLAPDDVLRCIREDALAASRAALQQRAYKRLTLIGKSLGTIVMSQLFADITFEGTLQAIWLTPVLRDPIFRALLHEKERSLLVIGDKDHYYDARLVQEFQAQTTDQVMLVPGADHSLQLGNDAPGSLRVLAQVMERMDQFLKRA
jgi:hypothetical protein